MAAALVEWWSQYLSVNLTCILAVLAGVAFFVWYRYGYLPYQYFKNLGVPGPKPLPFIGNLHQAKSELFDFRELCNKYGDVCGFYIGNTPVLVVANPEMVKEITIKQTASFLDRSEHSGVFCNFIDGKRYSSIFAQLGEDWRKSRQLISPAFSARNLKLLEPQVRESTKVLAERIAGAKGETVDVLSWYRELTSEVVMSTIIGHRVEVQRGEGTELFNNLQVVLDMLARSPGHLQFFLQIGAAMSWVAEYLLLPLIMNRFTAFGRGMLDVGEAIRKLIPDEVAEPKGPQIQLKNKNIMEQMADASRASNLDSFQLGHVATNAYVMIQAGHETTASALTFTSYLLALHPDVQERLAEEIDNYLQGHPDESLYDAAQELEYLDMVWQAGKPSHVFSCGDNGSPPKLDYYTKIHWGSRWPILPAWLFPATTFGVTTAEIRHVMINRRCNKDTVVNGIPIKEGCLIAFTQYYMHYRDDCWTDPEVFNPERFSNSQRSSVHPGAYIPFGNGPRICVGMRLAVMEAKMALIEVLSKFRIVKAPETKVPLELTAGTTVCFKDAVHLRFEERQ